MKEYHRYDDAFRKKIVALRDGQGYSIARIARTFNKPYASVKNIYHVMKAKMLAEPELRTEIETIKDAVASDIKIIIDTITETLLTEKDFGKISPEKRVQMLATLIDKFLVLKKEPSSIAESREYSEQRIEAILMAKKPSEITDI